jgi:SRSO17 transposase
MEWPRGEAEPTKYWLSTLPANTNLGDLVRLAKQRWIIERDYQELKQELGLGHFDFAKRLSVRETRRAVRKQQKPS